MSNIQVLPVKVYGQIAAGEVVERPSSIVRELVDNALDAKATEIKVYLDLDDDLKIQIDDNGEGIPGDELPLAITRYATSKIKTFEDIFSLETQGFRGEALFAISSVSKLSIFSSINDSGEGNTIEIKGEQVKEVKKSARAKGTTVMVCEIFFNTPVRKKFLKSLQGEKADIKRELIKQILANEETGFILEITTRGKTKREIDIPAHFGLKKRISYLFGSALEESLMAIDYRSASGATLKGWVSSADYHVKTKREQFFFVKKRAVNNPSLSVPLSHAFTNILPPRLYPACFLHMSFKDRSVDYNVHPAKKEVKFQSPDEVYRLIYHGVKDDLYKGIVSRQKKGLRRSLESESPANPPRENQDLLFDQHQGPSLVFRSNRASLEKEPAMDVHLERARHVSSLEKTAPLDEREDALRIPNFRVLGQVGNAYIVYAIGDELYIADQHAIHERMNFDDLKKKSQQKNTELQMLLVPLVLERNPSDIDQLFSKKAELKTLGFEIENFGEGKIKIEKLPSFVPKKKEREFVQGVFDLVVESPLIAREELLEKCLSTAACRMSIMAGDALTPQQMTDLIEALYKRDYIHLCPHGRPFIKHISSSELGKFFDRH